MGESKFETNPYHPPSESGLPVDRIETEKRMYTRAQLRWSLIILLLPCTYNLYCFQSSVGAQPIHAIANVAFLIGGAVLIWFYALPILEVVTRMFHRLFARASSQEAWLEAMYDVASSLVPYAVMGAILWSGWVFGFYHTEIGFYTISVPVGILAHLLAAAIYVRLFYHWYRAEKLARASLQR